MALGRFPPTVRLGGKALPESTVIDEIVIAWGRENLLDPNEPSTLQLGVLDPTATLGVTGLIGQVVYVDVPGLTVFRGRVTGYRIEPAAGDLFRVDITATDILADLARDLVWNENGTEVTGIFTMNASNADRISVLFNRALDRYLSSIEGGGSFTNSPVRWNQDKYVRRILGGEGWVFLEKIARVFRVEAALGVVNYNPHTNGLEVGRAAPAPTDIALVWDGALIQITAAGVGTLTIPAADLEYVGTRAVESTVGDAITTVVVNFVQERATLADGLWTYPVEGRSARATTAIAADTTRGARTLEFDIDEVIPVNAAQPFPSYAQGVANAWAAALDLVNDRLSMPPLRYVLDDHPADTTLDLFFLRLYAQAVGLYFAGSELRVLASIPLTVQVIGGEARWESGWEFTIRCAPAAGSALAGNVSIAELVPAGRDEPEFQDYAAAITLADLGTVTKGVT